MRDSRISVKLDQRSRLPASDSCEKPWRAWLPAEEAELAQRLAHGVGGGAFALNPPGGASLEHRASVRDEGDHPTMMAAFRRCCYHLWLNMRRWRCGERAAGKKPMGGRKVLYPFC